MATTVHFLRVGERELSNRETMEGWWKERQRRRTLWRLTPSATRQASLTLALDSLSLVSSAALFISHTLQPAPPPPRIRVFSLLTSESGPWSSAESTLFASTLSSPQTPLNPSTTPGNPPRFQ